MTRKDQGFTLIELMIVVAIIAIIAAVAIPNLLSARLAANESNAISTLRQLSSSQAQFQSVNAMDTDGDGMGEFGCFQELAGGIPVADRAAPPVGGELDPPIMASTFDTVDANGNVQKSGYFFRIYLPTAAGAATETPGVAPAGIDDDLCETWWCAYAWPVDYQSTGNRCFFTNHRGEIYQTNNQVAQHTGNAPAALTWDAAFDPAAVNAGDMGGGIAAGVAGTDGNTWTVVQ